MSAALSVKFAAGLFVAALGASFVACASDETSAPEADGDDASPPADQTDAPLADGGDASACEDCAFFPPECEDDRFCPAAVALEATHRLRSVSGTAPDDVWAVGTRGLVVHFDGTRWDARTIADGESLSSVVSFSRDEVWAAGVMDTVFVRSSDGGADEWIRNYTFESPDTSSLGYGVVRGVSRARTGSVWFVTAAADGEYSALTRVRRTPDGLETANAANVEESRFLGVHAMSEDEVWAVGAVGSAYRVRGTTAINPVVTAYNTRTFASLRGVWGASSNDVWAVGSEGTVRHYTGEGHAWEIVTDIPTHVTLRAITGTSASDIWAVGDDAVVLHYDGARWSRIAVAKMGSRRPALYAVWATTPRDVWIAGDGVLLSLGEKGVAP